jgi:pyruvate carboxylase
MAEALREAAARQAPPESALDDSIDHESSAVKNSVHQRLRANSSIMQMRKILGSYTPPLETLHSVLTAIQSPTVARSQSASSPVSSSKAPPNIISTGIFRTAHELSLHTVAVFSYEDRLGMHRQKADEAYVIGRRGQYTPVGAYLAGDEIIKIAVQHEVNMIHPGYGFLSENAEFARNVEKAGIIVSGFFLSQPCVISFSCHTAREF